jgi:aryl-alcohol dehydrogenase-like predicted oxidoreductase
LKKDSLNKIKLIKRFVIGSANFTQKYGADTIKINKNEIKKILELAKKNSIYKIDTAEGYLKDKIFFKNIDKKFKFTSKIIPDSKWISLEYCQKKLEDHFKVFKNNKVETLLLHDIQILFKKNGPKIFKNLEVLKKKKYFKKIGLSIYDTQYLDFIIPKFNIDVIQCPYNVLDKRIITTGWYDKLKNQGKEIHVRSIFLQGLLVNKLVYKKRYFRKWDNFFFNWFQFLENKNISSIDYCLSDLLKYDFDQIIVGINNSNNLKQIINFKTIDKNKMMNFKINDIKLIDPRKWN